MFKRYELSFSQLRELKEFSDSIDIMFFSTPTSSSGIKELLKSDGYTNENIEGIFKGVFMRVVMYIWGSGNLCKNTQLDKEFYPNETPEERKIRYKK